MSPPAPAANAPNLYPRTYAEAPIVCSFSDRLSRLYASITISWEAEKNVTANERTATLYKLINGLDCPSENIEIINST